MTARPHDSFTFTGFIKRFDLVFKHFILIFVKSTEFIGLMNFEVFYTVVPNFKPKMIIV